MKTVQELREKTLTPAEKKKREEKEKHRRRGWRWRGAPYHCDAHMVGASMVAAGRRRGATAAADTSHAHCML